MDDLIVESVRFFFLNMHYLWGEWLSRDRLMTDSKRPDRQKMEPQILNPRVVLHSVPSFVPSQQDYGGNNNY